MIRDIIHYEVVGPIGKALACGDIGSFCVVFDAVRLIRLPAGLGAMTEWRDIVQVVVDRFQLAIRS